MSFLLFQVSCIIYLLSAATYLFFFLSEKKKFRKVARWLFFIAAVLHTLNILFRYIEAGHTPITSHHETISFFAWATAWSYLSFRWRYTVKNLGTFVSTLVVVLMLVAAFSSRHIIPLAPVYQSWWLPVHASISLVAYAFLALSFLGSIMYLLQEREIKQKRFGLFYSRLPSLEALDKLNHHCLSVGFTLLTLGLVTGVLWAKQAWGAYWHWDPKETWSLITWFLYAGVMHQRFTVGWRGRRIAVISIIAFVSAMFTLWGVSFLLKGVHTYAS
ncbi:c-type cytochrome biogenesis protein CcsB [Desulfogranum marinum]|uniref:c-type cytochrome biogenesis protein CcsB n=1 Tax=Desulfogranum marinum TaxID=453220 RepID=UPI0019634870|nr:c-type cytochrome biogenesis protein CcsB [Desulfogranum marinum]MBM9511384.1 c-type cytochrome biogenesis protein CcsB [Desulfogranum marinum]